MSAMEPHPRPRPHASPSSNFSARGAPRGGVRLLLRVHSAENLRHVSSHGTYCKIYVGSTEMVRGSRHYRHSHKKLTASASAHNLGSLLASPFDSGRSGGGSASAPPSSSSAAADSADSADEGLAPRMRVLKTQVQKGKRPNPVWNEKFDIPVADPSRDILSIRVKSARLMSSPSIGACAVSLRIVPGATVDQWVRLLDGRKDAGRIRLQLRILEDPGGQPRDPPNGNPHSRRRIDPVPSASRGDEAPNQADSWLSLPDEAGPGAVAALPPHKPRRSLSGGRRDVEDVPVRENGGSSTSNESEPASEDPRGPTAARIVAPLPGARVLDASARRFRESRRRRRRLKLNGSPSLSPSSPAPAGPASVSVHAADKNADGDRDADKNLSGLDYGRSSAPTADSAPATTRVSFNSFVLPATSTLRSSPPAPRSSPHSSPHSTPHSSPRSSQHSSPRSSPRPVMDRGTMTLEELDKTRLQQARTRARTAPRESSRVHFDSDEDEDEYPVVELQPSPRRYSVAIFEDDAEVVAAHQEKLRLTDRSVLSTLSLASMKSEDEYDDEYEDEDEDEDEGAVDGEDEPRIPLNASLTKLLFRISANVLMEEEELEEEEEGEGADEDADEFVPILDFELGGPVDEIDCT